MDRVFSLFLPLNTKRFIFFSSSTLYLLGWIFLGTAHGIELARVGRGAFVYPFSVQLVMGVSG